MNRIIIANAMNTISEAFQNAFAEAMKEAGVNESEISSVMKKMEKKFMPEVKTAVHDSLEKAITDAKNEKAPKDPNAPKKARSGYQIFCQDVREKAVPKDKSKLEAIFGKENVSKAQEALKAEKLDMEGMGNLWKLVSDKGKNMYKARADEDKTRYQEELKEYVPKPIVKAPAKPASSAFELYYRENCTEEWKEEHEDLKNAKERREALKGEWNEESKDTQEEYAERVKSEKATYKKVLAQFESDLSEEEREIYKAKTDKNAPKKARSAYIFFSIENRDNASKLLLEENPNEAVAQTDIMKKMGEMWKEASTKEKAKFEKMAAQDKLRYEEELEQYKNGEYKAPEPKKASKAKSSKAKAKSDSDSESEEKKEAKKTGYMMFMTHRKKQLAEENEKLSKKEIQEMAIQEWKDLDKEDEESGQAFWKKVAAGEIELEEEEDRSSSVASASSKASTASDSKASKASKKGKSSKK